MSLNITRNIETCSRKIRQVRSVMIGGLCIALVAGFSAPAAAKEPVRPDPLEALFAKLKVPERYDPRSHCDLSIIENPHDDRVEYRAPKPDYFGKNIKIDMRTTLLEANPCHGNHGVRIPPKFPAEFLTGNTSGLCKFSFIYDADGQAREIDILNCTHEILGPATREAVRRWQVSDPNCFDENLPSPRQFSTMRYDLVNEDGNLLPLP